MLGMKVQPTRNPNSLQCFRCNGWGHMAQECPTPATALNQWVGTEVMWPNPSPVQQPTAGPKHSLPIPGPRPMSMRACQRMGQQEAAPFPFLNPDPIVYLVGCSNEVPLITDGQRMTALIDYGDQVSNISSQFCEGLTLQIQPLGRLLELEGTGSSTIPYLGYVEVNLQILGIKNYNEEVLLLVIPTMTYSENIPVMVGSKIIDWAMRIITKGELMKVTTTWKQAHFRDVMSGSLQLPHTGPSGTGVEKEVVNSSMRFDTMEVREFYLDNVWGPVQATQKVTIPPFGTVSVHGSISIRGHYMWVHVLAEPTPGHLLPTSVVLTVTYGELHLRSSQVPICLCNLSTCSVKIPTKTVVGQVLPANQVPPVALTTVSSEESISIPQKGWILEALDLQGLGEWPELEQE